MKTIYFLMLFTLTLCKDIQRPDILSFFLGIQTDVIGIVSSDLGPAGRFSIMTEDGISNPSIYVNIHSDAKARYQDGKIYIINRLNRDNIQVLDPFLGYITILEFSVGAGSNPYDFLKIHDTKAYISLYARNYILIVNPTLGVITGQIDLSAYADSDGIPEMSYMILHENRVYLAIQRLNRNDTQYIFPPTDYSSLLEIDPSSDTVIAEYKLQSTNPSKMQKFEIFGEPHLVIATPAYLGFNFRIDGGIEAFNLRTKTLREGFIYSEQTAGGDILDFVIKDSTTAYANVMYQDFSVSIQKFNPTTGEKISELAFYPAQYGYVAGMLLTPRGYLCLGDASFSKPGIMLYDTNRGDAKITALPVDIGLRPMDLIFIPSR